MISSNRNIVLKIDKLATLILVLAFLLGLSTPMLLTGDLDSSAIPIGINHFLAYGLLMVFAIGLFLYMKYLISILIKRYKSDM